MKAGWEVKPLGEVAKTTAGGTPKKSTKAFYDGGTIPWLVSGEVANANITEAKNYITEAGLKGSSAKIYPSNSVLIAMYGATAGEVGILRFEACSNQAVCAVLPNPDYLPEYLYYCLLNLQTKLAGQAIGNAQPNISQAKIKALEIPIPPLEEQKQIVAVLDAAFEGLTRAKENAEANLQNARELFESTLSYLFGQSEGWQETALNDYVSFMDYRGKTPPKRESGVRLITAKNVKRGFVQVEPKEFIDVDAYDGWMTRGFPEEGDVLFTTEAPLANVAQLDTLEKVVIGQRLITMKPDRDFIDREFLKFALMSPQMQEEIFSYATGATVLGIKAKLLKTVRFKFPNNLDDQRKVAAQCRTSFEKMDELTEVYRTKLTDISDLRQSLLQKAFAGELT